MKRNLFLVLFTLVAAAVLYLLLARDSRKQAAQSRANQIVITPDGKVSAAEKRSATVTWVAPKPTNNPPAATTTPPAK